MPLTTQARKTALELIAFVPGSRPLAETGYRIAGAHTDSPGLRR